MDREPSTVNKIRSTAKTDHGPREKDGGAFMLLDGIKKSAEAMLAMQTNLEILANNIANANTPGFCREIGIITSFSDILGDELASQGWHQVSSGTGTNPTLLQTSVTCFGKGKLKKTDNPANFAIEDRDGKRFFTIQTPEGVRFTRNGSFKFDPAGYLVTQDGFKVLGSNGPIKITDSDFKVLPSGKIVIKGKEVNSFLITTFDNPRQLKKVGDSNFAASTESGAKVAKDYYVRQNYIEMANVNVIKSMVDMMNIMRTFEANQKILQAEDQALGKAVNETGRVRG